MRTQFTQFLRAWRMSHGGMSAGEAAMHAKISENTWRQYESGARPGKVGLECLSMYFGCDKLWLLNMSQTACDHDLFEKAQMKAVREVLDMIGSGHPDPRLRGQSAMDPVSS